MREGKITYRQKIYQISNKRFHKRCEPILWNNIYFNERQLNLCVNIISGFHSRLRVTIDVTSIGTQKTNNIANIYIAFQSNNNNKFVRIEMATFNKAHKHLLDPLKFNELTLNHLFDTKNFAFIVSNVRSSLKITIRRFMGSLFFEWNACSFNAFIWSTTSHNNIYDTFNTILNSVCFLAFMLKKFLFS